MNNQNYFTIASVQFPNVFLRMDGTKTTKPEDGGSGTVNCQFEAGPYERLMLHGSNISDLKKQLSSIKTQNTIKV